MCTIEFDKGETERDQIETSVIEHRDNYTVVPKEVADLQNENPAYLAVLLGAAARAEINNGY